MLRLACAEKVTHGCPYVSKCAAKPKRGGLYARPPDQQRDFFASVLTVADGGIVSVVCHHHEAVLLLHIRQ